MGNLGLLSVILFFFFFFFLLPSCAFNSTITTPLFSSFLCIGVTVKLGHQETKRVTTNHGTRWGWPAPNVTLCRCCMLYYRIFSSGGILDILMGRRGPVFGGNTSTGTLDSPQLSSH